MKRAEDKQIKLTQLTQQTQQTKLTDLHPWITRDIKRAAAIFKDFDKMKPKDYTRDHR